MGSLRNSFSGKAACEEPHFWIRLFLHYTILLAELGFCQQNIEHVHTRRSPVAAEPFNSACRTPPALWLTEGMCRDHPHLLLAAAAPVPPQGALLAEAAASCRQGHRMTMFDVYSEIGIAL